jgi:hypothetical protein
MENRVVKKLRDEYLLNLVTLLSSDAENVIHAAMVRGGGGSNFTSTLQEN